MMADGEQRLAIHEAGHSVMAWRVGRSLGPVTIERGKRYGGCSWSSPRGIPQADWDRLDPSLPGVLWPARIRRHFETSTMVTMAGGLAELRIPWPVEGRTADAVSERVIELMPLRRRERSTIEEVAARDEMMPDDHKIADYASMFCNDDPALAGPWLGWLEAAAIRILTDSAARIEAVAAALVESKTLSARAVRGVIDAARPSR